jgi:hypothetical protein
MRSAIYGVIFTAFLVIPCVAQADKITEKNFPPPCYELIPSSPCYKGVTTIKGELDGKSLLCTAYSKSTKYPVYGLVFDKGIVTRWQVKGYSKVTAYQERPYNLIGTKTVEWMGRRNRGSNTLTHLDRTSLRVLGVGINQCSISSKDKIFQKLDEIIATAKRTNKI